MDTLRQYEDLNEEVKSFSIADWFLEKVFLITLPACVLLGLEVAVFWHANVVFFLGYLVGSYAGLLGIPAFLAAILSSPALFFQGKFKPTFALIFGVLWLLFLLSSVIGIVAMHGNRIPGGS